MNICCYIHLLSFRISEQETGILRLEKIKKIIHFSLPEIAVLCFVLPQPDFCACVMSGNGCGHTLLGAESGTVASQNYPGTYPSNTWCKWRIRVPEGRTLRLLFGDFDIESSPGCSNGSVVITDKNGEPSMGEN